MLLYVRGWARLCDHTIDTMELCASRVCWYIGFRDDVCREREKENSGFRGRSIKNALCGFLGRYNTQSMLYTQHLTKYERAYKLLNWMFVRWTALPGRIDRKHTQTHNIRPYTITGNLLWFLATDYYVLQLSGNSSKT